MDYMDFSQDHDSLGFLWVSSGLCCCDDGDKNGMIPGCPGGSPCAMIVESICNIIHDQGVSTI